ncbi:hypothetical protein F4824DRAFT_495455 [Ustulina deusta]|nr:hypothetical protein F4824DRAFT_495455 [Ustulina deusta]
MNYHAAGQANQPICPNPFYWAPSPELQNQIQGIVYHYIFAGANVGREEMTSRISYRLAPMSFDENLKPHLVFPAFWTYETFSAPLISIHPAEGTSIDWDRCFRELRDQLLEPRALHYVSVLLTNGESSQFHGPRWILMGGEAIQMGSNPDIPRLLETRTRMLQNVGPYALDHNQRHWLQRWLPLFTGLLRHRITSRGGIQDFLHRN